MHVPRRRRDSASGPEEPTSTPETRTEVTGAFPMSLRKLGPYEIREQIGAGGMATVYRAFQASMERYVAIKVIRSTILIDPVLRDRFQREARLIARLEHPHLLPIYDFDGDHDPPYIVMRFLEGGTLKQVLESGRIPHAEILYMLRQVASALDYAHRQGIVHRDLKPSNVMIDREGNAFLADFGIARISDGNRDLTGTGVLIGTPGYMAPEQARGESGVDARADIYALGATVFEMLAGRPPYQGESNLNVIMAHLNEDIPNICELQPELPRSVAEVMRTALAKDRERRYATAGALVEALGAALQVGAAGVPSQLVTMTETISLQQLAAREASRAESEASADTPSEQQRQMSAVYFDATALAEALYERDLEPDVVRKGMDRVWAEFATLAEKHGGVIQSRTDEMGVALWGRERAREDDAEQAVRAAIAMRTAAAEAARRTLGAGWEPSDDSPVPFAAGITTGPVLLERDSETSSYTVSGAPITLAGRLKESAPPGGILLDHDTYTQVRGIFTLHEHGAIRVRGRKEPVEVYLAIRTRPRAFRTVARGIEGVETKMIGREIELRLLQEAFTLTVEDAETQVVTVVGEAGVGKSRLLFEFTTWTDLLEQTMWFFEARATQPSLLQPFSLTRDLCSFRFQILDSDSLETVHEKFVAGVAGFLGPGSEDKAHLIGQLVGFDFMSYPAVAAAVQNPEAFQKQALGYLGELFLAATRAHPVFIQIEDIHWADDRSLDLISNLVRENTKIPLFVICMARPSLYERRPQWGEGERYHARIQLEPLSLLSSRRLVKELLKKAETVPALLRDLVIDRADGNPFYIEELIKALIDDGVIVKGEETWTIDETRLSSVRIPPTLTGVLQSRLDTLPTPLQQLLQRASVVGRVFWASAVEELSKADGVTAGAIPGMLSDLRRREMILRREESGFERTDEYVFRHAILRDVTYQTIVPRQRRTYHKMVGDWLLQVGGERASEQTPLVAKHYELAGQAVLAAEQLRQSAETATRHGSTKEAIQTLESALGLLGSGEHGALRLEIELKIGEAHAFGGDLAKGKEALLSVVEEARRSGHKRALTEALTQLARIHDWQTDLESAKRCLAEALPLARELGDAKTLVFALRATANSLVNSGEEGAEPYLLESIELAKRSGLPIDYSSGLNSLANLRVLQGRRRESVAYYREALENFRGIGAQFGIAMVQSNLAGYYVMDGDLEQAEVSLREGEASARELGNPVFDMLYAALRGFLHARRGDTGQAAILLRKAVEIAHKTGDEGLMLTPISYLGYLRFRMGEPHRGLEWIEMVRRHEKVDRVEQRLLEELVEEAAAGVSPEERAAAEARGRELRLEDVVAEILSAIPV